MKKNILAILISLAMLIAPISYVYNVAAFYCPPPGPTPPTPIPCWFITINETGGPGVTYNFTELEDGKCSYFTVEVSVINVTDLFGYEFYLSWDHDYFNLTGFDYATYADEMYPQGWKDFMPEDDYDYSKPYMQAISALGGEGFGIEEDHIVVVLTFHMVEDVCWCQDFVEGWIWISADKMYDSCSQLITPVCHIGAHWKYIAVQPVVYIDPEEYYNCKVFDEEDCIDPGTFTLTVNVANVTKMASIHFMLRWNKYHIERFCGENIWSTIINFTDVTINEDKFPEDNTTFTFSAFDWGTTMGVIVHIDTDFTNCDLLRGNFWIVEIAFAKHDPWIGNRQPEYFLNDDHCYYTENATTDIWFQWGYIDVYCPDPKNIYFGREAQLYASETFTLTMGWKGWYATEDFNFTTDYGLGWSPITITKNYYTDGDVEFVLYMPDVPGNFDLVFDDDDDTYTDWLVHWNSDPSAHNPPGTRWAFKLAPLWGGTDVAIPSWMTVWYSSDWRTFRIRFSTANFSGCCHYFRFAMQIVKGVDPSVHPSETWVGEVAVIQFPHGPTHDWLFYQQWSRSGRFEREHVPCPCLALYAGSEYTLDPLVGDLDGNGEVALADLMIMAWFYHADYTCAAMPAPYYDLNGDHVIDIGDIIVVAKEYGIKCTA